MFAKQCPEDENHERLDPEKPGYVPEASFSSSTVVSWENRSKLIINLMVCSHLDNLLEIFVLLP